MKFRDVCGALQKFRDFLLGRSTHVLHNRFNPLLAPRTLPEPEVPRGYDLKYSGQYYYTRNAIDSVKPPTVAPIALGLESSEVSKKICGSKKTGTTPKADIVFPVMPTPGMPYWWDAHCYFEHVPDSPKPKPCPPSTSSPPQPPPCPDASGGTPDPCANLKTPK